MDPRRSSRLQKAKNPQSSPEPDEEVIKRRLSQSQRRRTGLKKAEPGDGTGAEEGKVRDILDIISGQNEYNAEEDEGKTTEISDKGLDDSDEDSHSFCDSVASGPSLAHQQTLRKPSTNLCSSCRKLYQRAKRIKTQIQNKVLDNDPKSLTCDQWILIKKWAPSQVPNKQRRLINHIQLTKKITGKQSERYMYEEGLSSCSRPHTFLQRNLRCCVRVQEKKEKKKNRSKRRRNDSQGSRVRKQQRRHSNNHTQHVSVSNMDDDPNGLNTSGPSIDSYTSQEPDDTVDTDLNVELIPTTETETAAQPAEAPPKQKTPRKARGFRDLLSQLRGNTSVIIRETR